MNRFRCLIALSILSCLVMAGCQADVRAVWTGGSGSVPRSSPAPEGFTISPSEAQTIAEKRFGVRKTVRHIYADSRDYIIVDGFIGSSGSKAAKTGVRVNGRTGECTGFR